MSLDPIVRMLRDLPPDPPRPGNRFDQVRRRAVCRRRRLYGATAAGTIAVVVVGAVLAQQVGASDPGRGVDPVTQPHRDRQEPGVVVLGASDIAVGTGTEEIDLGPRPADADAVVFDLICRTAGTFTLPGGAGMTCDDEPDPRGEPNVAHAMFRVAPGERSALLRTEPNSSWSITTAWVEVDGREEGVKDRGTVLGQSEGYVVVQPETDVGELARVGGEVRLVDGCLGINDSVGLWPAGTRVVRQGPLAIDVPGVGLITVGSTVRGAGGFVQPGKYRGSPALPSSCANAPVVSFRAP